MKINEIVKEAVITQFQPGKTAQIQDKEKGVTYSLDLTNPQNMAALHPSEQGGLEFDPTPPQGAMGAQQQQQTIQPGAEVTINATEEQGDEEPAYMTRKPRYQYQDGPRMTDFGAPEYSNDPETTAKRSEWYKSDKYHEYNAAHKAHTDAQKAAQYKHAGVDPKQFDKVDIIMNPYFNPEVEDDEPEEIEAGIDYDVEVTGEDRPATWGYHGGEPPEYREVEVTINRVIDMESGEDITDKVDIDQLQQQIADNIDPSDYDDQDFEEDVGGDPTDEFIDDVTDKEFEKANKPEAKELDRIKKLSGL